MLGALFDQHGMKGGRKTEQRLEQESGRIQARQGPFRSVVSLLWAFFWISLAIWLVTGGSDSRHAVWDAMQLLRKLARDIVDSVLR